MIEVFKNILPKEINNKIILCLLDSSNWKIAKDLRNNQEVLLNDLLGQSGKDSGFSVRTFDEKENIYIHSPLNLYAEIIYEIVKQHTKYKFLKPIRFNWNYYNNSSQATSHTDNDEGYYVSFVYNLNTNNGGTNINDEFYKSNVGEAILFPSNFTHNSVAQTDTKGRFNLNCVIELQRSIS
jgi:hypothetical protein